MSTDAVLSLQRFVDAQAAVFANVRGELAAGRKRSHWMWFVFPQLRALGHSATAKFYGLADRDEAAAYLRHPLLGPRLVDSVGLVLGVQGRSIHEIFGSPDDLKLKSCLTLFEAVAPSETVFATALERCFEGVRDLSTLALLH